MFRSALLWPVALLACATGCQSLTPKWPTEWFASSDKKEITESKYPRPVRMAAIWSPALLNTPGKKPTRGFGGRLYFYDGQNNSVPVEGQLVVYGYNDSQQSGDGKTPDRRYAFTPEQFTTHYAPTDLGASYSIWIPWDEVGNAQVDVSLVPIFTAASGQLVIGQSSKALLPGPETPVNQTRRENFVLPPPDIHVTGPGAAGGVQQASYQESPPGGGLPAPGSNLQETSIRLPGTLAQQLIHAPAQDHSRGLDRAPALPPARPDLPTTVTTATSPRGSLPASHPMSSALRPPARSGLGALPAPSSLGLPPTRGLPPSPPYPARRPYGPPSPPAPGQ